MGENGGNAMFRNVWDRVTFAFLIVGALAWGYFITDTNILDVALEAIWDPLDDVVFILIGLSGIYWLFRAFRGTSEADS
jgi:uncharacterized membrane protein YuzA (DUF378 family)